jgi:starch-binding outer membrane protein, SusD/RagB family
MNMSNTIKNLSVKSILLLVIVFSGCKNFLDKPPQGNLTQASFPTTAADALLATNATYSTLRNWYFSYGGYPILDIMSDDAYKGSNPTDQATTVGPYDNFSINPSQDGLDRWWTTLYQGIKQANVVINQVPAIQMDPNLKGRYVAESKFLRALFYFDLVRAWGGVPVVTTLVPPLKLPRSTAAQVYSLITSDLLSAIDSLPDQSQLAPADYGRATKGAAEALLSKVYLFEKDFPDAETYSVDVINSAEYSLDPDFVHTFSVDGNFNSEAIFEIGALAIEDGDAGGNQFGNTQGVRGLPNKGWGFNRPSIDLRNTFESGDPRKKGTIINLGDTIDGTFITGDDQTPDSGIVNGIYQVECYNRKVWVDGTSTISEWSWNRRLIRYSEVLLIAAEASNEDGKTSQALQYLNEVRARAREGNNSILPDVTTTNQDSLRTAILHERRVELALEGDRFWDLVRTGNAVAVLGPLGFQSGKNELLPIPQSEIDLSEGSLTQNPGY